jgi:hypothetical protein
MGKHIHFGELFVARNAMHVHIELAVIILLTFAPQLGTTLALILTNHVCPPLLLICFSGNMSPAPITGGRGDPIPRVD